MYTASHCCHDITRRAVHVRTIRFGHRIHLQQRTLNEADARSRVNWPGVFTGLLAGVILLVVLGTLDVAFGLSTATSLGNFGTGAIIWTALTVLISAYMAGYTAVRAGNQGLASRGQFTGLVTGMLMTVALFLSNLVSGLVGSATSAIRSVASGAASGTAAANPGIQNAALSLLGNLNPDTLGQIIGEVSPKPSQAQSTAAANVVSGIIARASDDLGNNLGSVTNLSDFVTNRVNNIQKALSGPEFVTRLKRQGLSQAQAQAAETTARTARQAAPAPPGAACWPPV